jgi:transposase-like protein|tara:strand:- start:1486 stop:1806 length:321 start_codon:yes stop_codon:yes gene_type:complete
MALDIVCPTCESDEHLNGEPVGDGLLRLTCSACKVQWTRDPRPKCPICGGDDLYHLPQVILEKSRGTQMSIQGIHLEYGCHQCQPKEVKVRGGSMHHLPGRLNGSQ